jgi:hypothetical protein
MELTVVQAQELWLKASEASAANREAIRKWLFEQLVEAGFDVRDDIVIKLG